MEWNEERVINWFGERGVLESKPNKFEVKFPWLFINSQEINYMSDEDLIVSYYLDSIHCEAYTEWPAKDFDWSNSNLDKLCEELFDEINHDEFIKKNGGGRIFDLGLLAIDGDCGGGMSDHHDLIILNGDHFDKVSAYLNYELQSNLLLPLCIKETMDEYQTKFNNLWKSRTFNESELINLGIFGHKWHLRSTWILVGLSEGKPSTDFGFKLNILEQGKHPNPSPF